jgi:uncharacterized protein YktA (UPF0223 family)
MNDLVVKRENLPSTIEELSEFIMIGKEAVIAQKAKIRAILKSSVAKEAYDAALSDGQDIAEIVVDAEVRFGEFLRDIDKSKSYTGFQQRNPVLPEGVTKKQSHRAQTLAKHINVVEKEKEKARDRGELVTSYNIDKEIKDIKKQEKKEYKRQELIKLGKDYDNNSIQIIHGNFVEECNNIKSNSVDLILTDLPYPKEYLELWSDLSRIAERVLKPSGFCISYSGQLYLLEVINRMGEHLNYYWMMGYHHVGPTNLVHARNVVNEMKPILIYQKAPFKKVDNTFVDLIEDDKPNKDLHEWQQGEIGFNMFIERFSMPGDLILDPCAGAGTVPYCCKQLKRKCIGIEIDEKSINICKGRLVDVAK